MRSEALKKAQLKYYHKIKNDETFKEKNRLYAKKNYDLKKNTDEFKQKRNEYARTYYYKNREAILQRRKNKYTSKKNDEEIII